MKMKRLLAVLVSLLLAVPASADLITAGQWVSLNMSTPVLGGTANTILYIDGSSTLGSSTGLAYNDSGAGNGTFSLLKTMSGASATSNFFNLTGTLPSTLSAAAHALNLQITTAGSTNGSALSGINVDLLAGHTGSNSNSYGLKVTNAVGNNGPVYGTWASVPTSGVVTKVGGYFETIYGTNGTAVRGTVYGNTTNGYGAYFDVVNGTNQVGVLGNAATTGGTVYIGGYFALGTPSVSGTSALVADNRAIAANIFEARDNGTAMLTVKDGGEIAATSGAYFSKAVTGHDQYGLYLDTNAVNYRNYPIYVNYSGYVTYLSHGSTPALQLAPLGTGTIRIQARPGSPDFPGDSLIIHPGSGTGNAQPSSLSFQSAVVGASGAAEQSRGTRFWQGGGYTTLTEATATTFATVPIPASTVAGGDIVVTVEANDATDFQARTLTATWSAVNKAGTITTALSTPVEAVAVSAGTLTCTLTLIDATSNNAAFQLDCTSSLTQTVLRATPIIKKNFGAGVIS